MGYYSDVALTMYVDDFKNMINAAKSTDVYNDVGDLFERADIVKSRPDIVTFFWESIKWYEHFSDVGFVENYLSNTDINYSFKRIGEDMTDVEERYRDNDWVLFPATDISRRFDIYGDYIDLDFLFDSFDKPKQEPEQDYQEIPAEELDFILSFAT